MHIYLIRIRVGGRAARGEAMLVEKLEFSVTYSE